MLLPIIVLIQVFILIAVRQIGNIRLQFWHIMLLGATAVLITGQISPSDALKAINLDVIFFLVGMFVVGQALEESGYLSHILYRLFKKADSADKLILYILFGMGVSSALLMNDTLAIIGTSAVLLLARKHNLSLKPLLLTLAFAITIGSVISPIGNPQNLLIAINGDVKNPFITFLKYLLLPTIINLFLTYIIIKFFYYNDQSKNGLLKHSKEPINDPMLARLCKVSLLVIGISVSLKIIISLFLNTTLDFKLTYIALIAALPILTLSTKRVKIIKGVDWHTIIFFAAMFVLMQAVWDSGFFQATLTRLNIDFTSISMILIISTLLSQLISNVPLTALLLPMLNHAGVSVEVMMALAVGSTIAGNLFILGAASNVIIIQNAEKKSGETLKFLEFARIGIPLTAINLIVYWIFLIGI
ncbi:MAG: anion transporter [Nitrospinae bacterium]|nr:anion transporter [Nitrospinota bacterium]